MAHRIEVWEADPDRLVAEGFVASDGAVCLRAARSWVHYARVEDLQAAAKQDRLHLYTVGDVAVRASSNALQDRCENIPYGSVVLGIQAGGPAPPRETWQAPEWIAPSERDLYLQEYARAIAEIFGVEPAP